MKTRYGSLTPTEAAKMIMISNLEFEINSFDVGKGAATKYDDRESMQLKMAKSYTTETIPSEFLSEADDEFISELIADWHWESDRNIGSFSFTIQVTWDNNNE